MMMYSVSPPFTMTHPPTEIPGYSPGLNASFVCEKWKFGWEPVVVNDKRWYPTRQIGETPTGLVLPLQYIVRRCQLGLTI